VINLIVFINILISVSVVKPRRFTISQIYFIL